MNLQTKKNKYIICTKQTLLLYPCDCCNNISTQNCVNYYASTNLLKHFALELMGFSLH